MKKIYSLLIFILMVSNGYCDFDWYSWYVSNIRSGLSGQGDIASVPLQITKTALGGTLTNQLQPQLTQLYQLQNSLQSQTQQLTGNLQKSIGNSVAPQLAPITGNAQQLVAQATNTQQNLNNLEGYLTSKASQAGKDLFNGTATATKPNVEFPLNALLQQDQRLAAYDQTQKELQTAASRPLTMGEQRALWNQIQSVNIDGWNDAYNTQVLNSMTTYINNNNKLQYMDYQQRTKNAQNGINNLD